MNEELKQRLEYDYGLQLKDSGIKKLDYFLNYSFPVPLLYFASFFVLLLLPLLAIVSVVFSVYMIYVLYKNRKYGWITSFIIMVLLPLLAGMLFTSATIAFILAKVSMGAFFLYCFVLKSSTRDWVADENARMELYKSRRLKQLQNDIFSGKIGT